MPRHHRTLSVSSFTNESIILEGNDSSVEFNKAVTEASQIIAPPSSDPFVQALSSFSRSMAPTSGAYRITVNAKQGKDGLTVVTLGANNDMGGSVVQQLAQAIESYFAHGG